MTSLTFYGGVNEVGGNKILLEDKDTKVFLDFGMSFGKRGDYFDEFMSPRTPTGLKDFIEMGLIPDIKNTYRTDLLKMMDRNDTETDIDGILCHMLDLEHDDLPWINPNQHTEKWSKIMKNLRLVVGRLEFESYQKNRTVH